MESFDTSFSARAATAGDGARLLLVDDDRKFVRLLSEYLRSNGFVVETAFDGHSGLERVKSEQWDLVVLDVMLPNLGGFQVLRGLRTLTHTPVLMLTGRGGEDDRIRGLDWGADDYLPKTVSARELLARLRALLRRAALKPAQESEGLAEPSITIGTLSIDPSRRQVELAGVEVKLTPVEFDLLETLARHRGHVRSREQLLNTVRDRDFDVMDRSIDVHVASLRRKLGDDPRAPSFIRTVRGAGYVLDAAQAA